MEVDLDDTSTWCGPRDSSGYMKGAPAKAVPWQTIIRNFRFMDLVLEIRNQVYQELLCPYPEHSIDKDGRNYSTNLAPHFETAILYTNRQIHDEAREVMLRGNQFVRILTHGVSVFGILTQVPVHIVTHSNSSDESAIARDCQGAAMTYSLRDEDNSHEPDVSYRTFYALILGRDLDAFVRGIGDDMIADPTLPRGVKHSIHIHASSRNGEDPNYSSLTSQRRMLQPFRDHLHGFEQVEITGDVDSQLAATVITEMRQESIFNLNEFMASVTQLKEEGNVSYRSDLHCRAIDRWQRASFRIMHLWNSVIWCKAHKNLDTDFENAVVEMFFFLNINVVQALLAQMHEFDPKDLKRLNRSLSNMLQLWSMASNTLVTFTVRWRPSARQEAKLGFRIAQAARLARAPATARWYIEKAEGLQPNDVSIQQERAKIDRMAVAMTVWL